MLEGLLDGTIDCIVTDHAPHAPSEKADFRYAPNGVIGMETSLAASLKLVHAGLMTLPQLVQKMAENPRKILGLPQHQLAVGEPADLTLVDLDYHWTVDPEKNALQSEKCDLEGQNTGGQTGVYHHRRHHSLSGYRVFRRKEPMQWLLIDLSNELTNCTIRP